eukprot:366543-Chlamydomonas_euryale.AAC.5
MFRPVNAFHRRLTISSVLTWFQNDLSLLFDLEGGGEVPRRPSFLGTLSVPRSAHVLTVPRLPLPGC